MMNDFEHRLRSDLRRGATAVEPSDRLDEILAGAAALPRKSSGGRRQRLIGLSVAASVAAVGAAALAGIIGDNPEELAGSSNSSKPSRGVEPSAALSAPSAASPAVSTTARPLVELPPPSGATSDLLPVYYSRSNGGSGDVDGREALTRTFRQSTIPPQASPEERVEAAVEESISMRSDIWGDSEVTSVTVSADSITVDLTARPATASEEDAQVVYAGLAWTAQAAAKNTELPVTITVAGENVLGEEPADGITRQDASAQTLADIWISAPTEDTTLTSTTPVVLEGAASVDERTLNWQLRGPGGDTVSAGTVEIGAPAPDRATYAITIGTLDPGAYVVTVSTSSALGETTASAVTAFTVN